MAAPLILASTSPYRRQLLARLSLDFVVERPTCDEAAFKLAASSPSQLATTLAAHKARSIAQRRSDAIVIGSDQVCALGDDVFDKPGDRAGAIAQLQRLRGRAHAIITAVCVCHGSRESAFVDVSELTMRALTDAEIERYVDADRPFDCAGAYKLESAGIALFARVVSSDHTAITGLPLLQLCRVLRDFGVDLP